MAKRSLLLDAPRTYTVYFRALSCNLTYDICIPLQIRYILVLFLIVLSVR